MSRYVCIDIGGTAIKYGLADELGKLLDKGSMETRAQDGVSAILHRIKEQVAAYQLQQSLDGIAVSTAGMVDPATGSILFAGNNLPGYTGTEVKAILERECGIPCEVENDVNCAGLGELWLGAGQGSKSLVCITVGTGIGGCVILDGHLVHGAGCCAGEIGYMEIGEAGTLEQTAAVPQLLHEVAAARKLPPETVDGAMVFRLARTGDADAVNALEHMMLRLAKGIANICYVLNPERVILGGGIMAQREYLGPRMAFILKQRMVPAVWDSTRLEFAALGNDAGMLGALYNFLQKHRI